MTKLNELLTGKAPGQDPFDSCIVKKQLLATAMAIQILNEYPKRGKKMKSWESYKYLRGVLLADEVGGGKTFEALSIISRSFFALANNKRKPFRVLIIAAPSIRSKWEWKEETEDRKPCDLKKFIKQTTLSRNKKVMLENLFKTAEEKKSRIIKKDEKRYFLTSKKQWKHISKSIRKQNQGIWITSFGHLPKTQRRRPDCEFQKSFKFPTNRFDYIIADEAHIVKSGYLNPAESSKPKLNNTVV